ncbi:MAG: hypothetical protein HY553_09230 [Elusimicrobia bacterium]|nr:hypothetical protein [Elusimicrobiota bacterium]
MKTETRETLKAATGRGRAMSGLAIIAAAWLLPCGEGAAQCTITTGLPCSEVINGVKCWGVTERYTCKRAPGDIGRGEGKASGCKIDRCEDPRSGGTSLRVDGGAGSSGGRKAPACIPATPFGCFPCCEPNRTSPEAGGDPDAETPSAEDASAGCASDLEAIPEIEGTVDATLPDSEADGAVSSAPSAPEPETHTERSAREAADRLGEEAAERRLTATEGESPVNDGAASLPPELPVELDGALEGDARPVASDPPGEPEAYEQEPVEVPSVGAGGLPEVEPALRQSREDMRRRLGW